MDNKEAFIRIRVLFHFDKNIKFLTNSSANDTVCTDKKTPK